MFYTPRFSYDVVKLAVRAGRRVLGMVRAGRVYRAGMGPGGYRGGYTGGVPSSPPTARGECPVQRSGPRKPCKGWSGWYGVLGRTVGGTAPETTLRARSAPAGLPVSGPSECPPRANIARFQSILSKVSQNSEVSPKSVHKACHSPYFQNGSGNPPLEILGFPFPLAFSHKELLTLF